MPNFWDDHDVELFDDFGSDCSMFYGRFSYSEINTLSSGKYDYDKHQSLNKQVKTPYMHEVVSACLYWLEECDFSEPILNGVNKVGFSIDCKNLSMKNKILFLNYIKDTYSYEQESKLTFLTEFSDKIFKKKEATQFYWILVLMLRIKPGKYSIFNFHYDEEQDIAIFKR